jgi:site-specific DNA-methyltransferase (adenine-specific)
MRAAPPGLFDVTITDPPYEAHCQDNQMSGTTLEKVALPFDPLTDKRFVLDLLKVTKRWVLSFCTVEDLGLLCHLAGGRKSAKPPGAWVRGGIWYKPNSMGQLSGDRPAASYEGLAILHRPDTKYRWNGRGGFAFWACNGTRGEKSRHPNQKPLSLCLELVNKFSEPGETIFDPFAGSGRIGEAALLLGRNYVGLDNDPAWVEQANARLARTTVGAAVGQIPLHAHKLEKSDAAWDPWA